MLTIGKSVKAFDSPPSVTKWNELADATVVIAKTHNIIYYSHILKTQTHSM